jgi:hypothetical protein
MKIELYTDGSGAPAVVDVSGWKFALDYIAEVRCRLITQSSSREPPKWAAEHARKLYSEELSRIADPSWFELNKAMYA